LQLFFCPNILNVFAGIFLIFNSDLSGTIHTSTRNKGNGNWIDEDDEPQLFTMTNLLSMGNIGSYFNDDKAAQQLNNSGFFSCTDLNESNLDEGTSEWLLRY